MLNALTLLLVFQLLGETLTQLFALPVPGPVIGMTLLFCALAWRGGPSAELRETASRLLQHLSLLFVPAGVGIMLHFQRLGDEWLSLLLAVIASTLLTLAVTAVTLQRAHRAAERKE